MRQIQNRSSSARRQRRQCQAAAPYIVSVADTGPCHSREGGNPGFWPIRLFFLYAIFVFVFPQQELYNKILVTAFTLFYTIRDRVSAYSGLKGQNNLAQPNGLGKEQIPNLFRLAQPQSPCQGSDAAENVISVAEIFSR